MRRGPRPSLLLSTLIDEVDNVIVGMQTVRQLLAEYQRLTVSAPGHRLPDVIAAPPASLRYAGITVAEAADILEMSEEHVRRLLRRGELEGISFGGRVGWRLSREYVETVAEQARTAKTGQTAARERPRQR